VAFTSLNEIEIVGGTAEGRRAAAALFLASDSADEDSAAREDRSSFLVVRFESVDGLPEEDLQALAPQFPDLSFTLVYFSQDGEFYGYAKAGAEGSAAESDDFAEDASDTVARRHDGDRIAFVRELYSLARP
jgi:hypothetical protein